MTTYSSTGNETGVSPNYSPKKSGLSFDGGSSLMHAAAWMIRRLELCALGFAEIARRETGG